MSFQSIAQIVALAQGTFVIGMTLNVLLTKHKEFRVPNAHMAMTAMSYVLITAATVLTMTRQVYEPGDPWFLLVGAGYILGDISLFKVYSHLRRQRTEEQEEKMVREYKMRRVELPRS